MPPMLGLLRNFISSLEAMILRFLKGCVLLGTNVDQKWVILLLSS